jgi:hypothetical protein
MARLRTIIVGVALLAFVLVAWPSAASAAAFAETNLIFFHHSVGSDWLSRNLCAALNANGYHVADTNYGWPYDGRDYGSYTDTVNWPTWFTDSPSTIMDLAYAEMDLSAGSNTLGPAPGENTIVMFKSCFPNSDVGSGISDEQAIYNSLIPYFEDHPDKMFVLVTPPPMQHMGTPLLTRQLCNWLTDRQNGWLKDLTTGNVFVFDFYNVLTHPGAHHYLSGGIETHTVVAGANTLYYDSSGDDHPNAAGDAKAAAEFVPLLNAWYDEFLVSSGSAPRRVQQTDPRITYLGEWSNWSSPAESGDSLYYTAKTGAAALVSFSGTTFELLAAKGPSGGEVSISIDGGPALYRDLYSPSSLHQQSVFERTDLADTTHTATILCGGTANPASSGSTINIDAVRVLGALSQAAAPVRNQQEDAHVRYAGTWGTSSTWSASGGSLAYADSPGSAVNVTFDGTYLALYARKGPGFGRAQVCLDGGTPVLVDLYAPADQYKKRVYNTGLLTEGSHSLSIYWTGQKNSAASGNKIDVDTFDLMGALADGSEPVPILWRYQQTDPKLTYLGSWSPGTTWSASGGSYYSTDKAGAAILVSFSGTSVKLIAKTAPWYGRAEVTLDGVTTTEEFYSATQLYKQPVYVREGLSPGAHTLTVKCIRAKGPASSGYAVGLDALDINGYLTQAPRTTRIQDNDAAWIAAGDLAYVDTWNTGTTWSASGGSFRSSAASDDQVTVRFTGRYLAWVAKTCPWYGRAQVTLDGGPPVTVDLYSSSTVWKKQVYDTGLLTDEPHTLVIWCTGNKYWRSWGTSISVDALDILPGGA